MGWELGDFLASRGLTRGFAGFFAGARAFFPVRAMGYELCGMRMERPVVGKSKGQYGDSGCARMTTPGAVLVLVCTPPCK